MALDPLKYPRLSQLERAAAEMNASLVMLAIGLAALDLVVFLTIAPSLTPLSASAIEAASSASLRAAAHYDHPPVMTAVPCASATAGMPCR